MTDGERFGAAVGAHAAERLGRCSVCDKCYKTAQRLFPDVPEESLTDLLWGATCFPFGSAEQITSQLQEMHNVGLVTLEDAMAYAERKMDKAMERMSGGRHDKERSDSPKGARP